MSKRPIGNHEYFNNPPSKRFKRCSTPEILLRTEYDNCGARLRAFPHSYTTFLLDSQSGLLTTTIRPHN